ncbi:hypothetical protein BG10_4906 [Bacillus thuringiensis serovar morrisoni]|nr:hypothetical protein BG10_4906 [Bacillus thuringiensis serovar morrisoni]
MSKVNVKKFEKSIMIEWQSGEVNILLNDVISIIKNDF